MATPPSRLHPIAFILFSALAIKQNALAARVKLMEAQEKNNEMLSLSANQKLMPCNEYLIGVREVILIRHFEANAMTRNDPAQAVLPGSDGQRVVKIPNWDAKDTIIGLQQNKGAFQKAYAAGKGLAAYIGRKWARAFQDNRNVVNSAASERQTTLNTKMFAHPTEFCYLSKPADQLPPDQQEWQIDETQLALVRGFDGSAAEFGLRKIGGRQRAPFKAMRDTAGVHAKVLGLLQATNIPDGDIVAVVSQEYIADVLASKANGIYGDGSNESLGALDELRNSFATTVDRPLSDVLANVAEAKRGPNSWGQRMYEGNAFVLGCHGSHWTVTTENLVAMGTH